MSSIERVFSAKVVEDPDNPDTTIVQLGSLSQAAKTQLETRLRTMFQTAFQPVSVSPVEVGLMSASIGYIVRVHYTPNPSGGGSADLAQISDITLDGHDYHIRLGGGQVTPAWSMPAPSSMRRRSINEDPSGPPEPPSQDPTSGGRKRRLHKKTRKQRRRMSRRRVR
jgi:hypothetical protein